MNKQPKYRRLTQAELTSLEPEFVQFLASQSIPANDWETLKKSNPEKVEGLITIFSDLVMDKVLSKVELLERRSQSEILLYRFMHDRIYLRGMRVVGSAPIHLNDLENAHELVDLIRANEVEVKLISAEKPIGEDRLSEAFTLIQQGCLLSHNLPLYGVLDDLCTEKT